MALALTSVCPLLPALSPCCTTHPDTTATLSSGYEMQEPSVRRPSADMVTYGKHRFRHPLIPTLVIGKANMTELASYRSRTVPNGWSAAGGQTVNAYVSYVDRDYDWPVAESSYVLRLPICALDQAPAGTQ